MQNAACHLGIYQGSVAAGSTYIDVGAINDQILTKQNNHFVMPQNTKVLWGFALGTDLSRVRLNVPSLRYIGLPSISPVQQGTTVQSPGSMYDPGEYPMTIEKGDEVAVEAIHANAGAQTVTIGIGFGFNLPNRTSGPCQRTRFTTSGSITANAWSNLTLTPDSVLPGGEYSVVGMDVVGDDCVFGRLVFPGGGWRPGVVCRQSIASVGIPKFTSGDLGEYGRFDNTAMPSLDLFALAAVASMEVYLDLIRVAGSRY